MYTEGVEVYNEILEKIIEERVENSLNIKK